jgi:hypothetical protein
MKKFNNTLEGTDCGNAGLPAPCRSIARSESSLRIVPKGPEHGTTVIQFPNRHVNPVQQPAAQAPRRCGREVR